MSTFHLLSQDKRDELCSMLPQADQNALLNHSNNYENYQPPYQHHHQQHRHQPPPPPLNNENYNPSYNNAPDFFSKTENPIFWNSLTEWQTMLGHGDFVNSESPLQLSPSPPTTTNNSSSNKSTASYGSKSHKSFRATCKKDRFKVKKQAFVPSNMHLIAILLRTKPLSPIGASWLIRTERIMLQGELHNGLSVYTKLHKS